MTPGFLVIDKAPGLTSHDIVAMVRAVLGIKKVGHAGTLDPMATGLLVVAIGPVTRLIRFAQDAEKEYLAIVRGVPTEDGGRIDHDLGSDMKSEVRLKHAWRVLERLGVVVSGTVTVAEIFWILDGTKKGLPPKTTGQTASIQPYLTKLFYASSNTCTLITLLSYYLRISLTSYPL